MKHTKIILAAILAVILTACSDANTAEVTEEITESSVSETASEVTTTEVTTTDETTTTTEEETTLAETTVSETETESALAEETVSLATDFDFVINGGGYNENVIKEMNEIPSESGLKQCEFKNTDIDSFTALYRQHHMFPDESNENELIWFWSNDFYFTVGETDYLYLASTTENCGMLYNLTANAEYELTRVGDGRSFISGDENGVYLVTYTEGALWLGETVFDLTMGEKILENSFEYDTPEQEHELSSEMQYYSSLVPYIEFNL
ncbi:MAG: hypothetical protein NC253_01645 [Ruminococcus sp.]|nr:hypothetical protein [Ruminococcus sp.]MCM1380738.1 hypothetical protein [Muribaculaceae bacterium]MCM1478862.1 hypothetical protein [Muribaculaceae bacterium]